MTPQRRLSQRTLGWLLLAPAALFAVLIVPVMLWGPPMPDTLALSLVTAAALLAIAGTLTLNIRHERSQDEVQRASALHASQGGMGIGVIAAALFLLVPGSADWAAGTAAKALAAFGGDAENAPGLAFAAGIGFLALAQGIGSMIASTIWWGQKK